MTPAAFAKFHVFTIGNWQPKIGDPSIAGWLTVFSYYACAGLSLVHVLKTWPRLGGPVRRFGILLTIAILFLGISKHINLPGAITEIGRLMVYQIGGYAGRRWIQVAGLLFAAIGCVLLIRRAYSREAFLVIWEHRAPEMICLLALGVLFFLRVISLHQIGALLSAELFGVRVNWIVELAAIYTLMAILLRRMAVAGRTGAAVLQKD